MARRRGMAVAAVAFAAAFMVPSAGAVASASPTGAPRHGIAPQLSGAGHHVHRSANGETDVNACSDDIGPGHAMCMARVRTSAGITPALGDNGAYSPAYLQSAYNVPSATHGYGRTIGIVDAYDSPTAEDDLAAYRAQFGLPECTTDNGCFVKEDQNGGTAYPSVDSNWALEISLDVDMASAICPNCRILLVEANSASYGDLTTAEGRAVSDGADVVSNSWGSTDFNGAQTFNAAFDVPGVPILFSTGDSGYGAAWPASSSTVIAVGGTTLHQLTSIGTRNATETVWNGAGSGCSASQPKPVWQSDVTCTHRMIADVSADADPNTGAWIYDDGGWYVVGGTSEAAPIVASVYALAKIPSGYPASYLYAHSGSLNDVIVGTNGVCGTPYYCNAAVGYDGPTGLGTPNGLGAFGGVGAAPTNTGLPVVSGDLEVGGDAIASAGTWDGDGAIDHAYQWERCDDGGANCVDIDGATESDYVPVDGDAGATLRVAVTATNFVGISAPALSDPSAEVTSATAPESVLPPTIGVSSTNVLGLLDTGTWTGSAETSHAMQWQACDSQGANCADMNGETDSTYSLQPGDVGTSIRLEYSKTNTAGTGLGDSDAMLITSLAPANNTSASISGSTIQGHVLTAANGSWTSTDVVTYTHQWQRCGTSCVDITNATGSSYILNGNDVGKTIKVRVRGTNGWGFNDSTSLATATIAKGVPVQVTAPAVSGTAHHGSMLTSTSGTWRGTGPITVTGWAWLRCNSLGAACVVIAGASHHYYVPTAADEGHRLRSRVYERNSIGTAVGTSNSTAVVT